MVPCFVPPLREPWGRHGTPRSSAGRGRVCATGWLLAAGLSAAACETAAPSGGPDAPAASVSALETSGASAPGEAPEGAPSPETDPQALAELLQAAPAQRLPATGPDGGTLVGTDTEVAPDDEARRRGRAATTEPPARGVLRVGTIEVQPGPSNAAIESAMRAQIYWPLVHKCRDPNGDILPPDAVTLTFTVRIDGSVDPGTVSATAAERRFDDAAECMMRAFSAIGFRGPASSVGQPSRVVATIPSVD